MEFLNTANFSTLERVPTAKVAGGGGGCLFCLADIANAIFEENRSCLFADFRKHLNEHKDAQRAYQLKSTSKDSVKGATRAQPLPLTDSERVLCESVRGKARDLR